jgi:5-hydroxyisourate hydrolase
MSGISTHVLDTALGRPATGIPVLLERLDGGVRPLHHGETDADGRVRALLPEGAALEAGLYRLTFETAVYLDATAGGGFYPEVSVVFRVADGAQHHHVPLLLSPFGYSTYRGS